MTRRARVWLLRELAVPVRMGRPRRLTLAQRRALPTMLETMTRQEAAERLGVGLNTVARALKS